MMITWHLSTNIAEKRRSLGQYRSLVNLRHGVQFLFILFFFLVLSIINLMKHPFSSTNGRLILGNLSDRYFFIMY
jgi:hypothetical protein